MGCWNVVAILSMADLVCLDCMQKLCSAYWVCMVCGVFVEGIEDSLEENWKGAEHALVSYIRTMTCIYHCVTDTLQNQTDGRNLFVRNLKHLEGLLIPFDAHLSMKT